MTKRRTRSVTLVFAVVALVTAAVPVAASPAERPIREALSGYGTGITFADPENLQVVSHFGGRCGVPSNWISTSSGSGTVSHLGLVLWSTEHCFQLGSGTFGEAELVITAANGDQLFGTYDGVMTGPTTFVEEMSITGGTGRFVGANGVIVESGWFDPNTGYMEVTGEGWVTYDPPAPR